MLPGLMGLDFYSDIQMVGPEFGVNMKIWILVSLVQTDTFGVMVWGIFYWHDCLNVKALVL